MERVDTLGGNMFLVTHHNEVVTRYRTVDNKNLELLVIGVVGIGTLALVLTAASGRKHHSSGHHGIKQIFLISHFLFLLF
jgi:hypothetical protein